MPHAFQTDDTRLVPIAAKIQAAERLSAEDALALYASPDILAIGWMANLVREKAHVNKTFFNVKRHINPTNVFVAACSLCAYGCNKDSAVAYTLVLEEAWQAAGSGYSETVTEFHTVSGL